MADLADGQTRFARLGWPAGILNGGGAEPKRLHWTTYYHFKAEYDRLTQINFRDMGRKLGFLHQPLEP